MSMVEVTYLYTPPRDSGSVSMAQQKNRYPLLSMEFDSIEQAMSHQMPPGYDSAIFKDGDDRYVYTAYFGWQKIASNNRVFHRQFPQSQLFRKKHPIAKLGGQMVKYTLQYDDINRTPDLEPFASEQYNRSQICENRDELNDAIKRLPLHTRIRYSSGSTWKYSIVGADNRIHISMIHCSTEPKDV